MIGRLSQDPSFWAALLAGPFTWGLLTFSKDTAPDLLWPLRSPLPLLLPGLVYPFLEELVFRGWLQGWLGKYPSGRQRIGPVSWANLVTSVVFAGCHLVNHPPVWALAVLPPSLIFGFFRDKYQRLTPAIILHVFYNMGFFWLFTTG